MELSDFLPNFKDFGKGDLMDKDEIEDVGFIQTSKELIMGWTSLIFFSILCILIYTTYTQFFYLKFIDWTGGETLSDGFFEFILISFTAVVMLLIIKRYQPLIIRFDERFFSEDETLKNAIIAIWVFFVMLVVSGLILLSCMAFIVGTAFSLGLFTKPDLSGNESILLVPLFIFGVTFVTLAIGEALKTLDNFLRIGSDEALESERIKEIYEILVASNRIVEEE